MPVDANWDGFQSTTIPANRYQQMFINGYLDVSGRTIIRNGDLSLNDGRLFVKSDVSFNSKMFVSGDANLNGKLTVTSDASLNAKLTVASDASLNGKLTVASDASLNAKLTVASDASLNGRLTVAGDASLNGNISLNGNLYVAKNVGINNSSPTHPLDVTGNIKTTGNILVGNDASITGNATISGNLTVNGNLTATKINNKYIVNTTTNNYQLIVSEDLSLNGRLFVGGNVGIGKTNPSVALDVNGNVRCTAGYDLNYSSVPTYTSNQIGYIFTGNYPTANTGNLTATTNIGANTDYVTLPSVGVWLLFANGKVGINNNVLGHFDLWFNIDGTGEIGRTTFYLGDYNSIVNLSGVFNCTNTNNFIRIAIKPYVQTSYSFAANAFTIKAVRIA